MRPASPQRVQRQRVARPRVAGVKAEDQPGQEEQPLSIERAVPQIESEQEGFEWSGTTESTTSVVYNAGAPMTQGTAAFGGAGGVLPTSGSVSQAYGVRNSRYAAGFHTGLDIAAPVGTPIYSPVSGTVLRVGYDSAYGNRVEVRNSDGTISLFAHMSGVNVRVGQQLSQAQQIGTVGSTGQSTGAHLHWEIRTADRYGAVIDPMEWLNTVPGSGGGGGASNLGASSQWTARPGDARAVTQNAYQIMRSIGASHDEARFLASVVMPESGGNPTAVNRTSVGGSNATGLWQIMFPLHRGRAGVQTRSQLYNPINNARVALSIYRDQGQGAWEVTRLDGGRHRQYLQYV